MRYLKLFKTEADYIAYRDGGDYVLPNVCYAKDDNKVHYSEILYSIKNYIVGDGKAYIKTDYYISNYDVMEFYYAVPTGDYVLLGSKGTNFWVHLLQTQDAKAYMAWDMTSSAFQECKSARNTILGMVIKNEVYRAVKWQDNGTEVTLKTYSGIPEERICDKPLCIFTRSLADSDGVDERISAAKIGEIIIKDSRTGSVKLHLKPAVSFGVIGMVDEVSKKFYANANTEGSFKVE